MGVPSGTVTRRPMAGLPSDPAPAPVAKTFGTVVPQSFQQGEVASQMTPQSPFSPGMPIGPYDGYDRTPRTHNFVTGFNIATRPRTHERVSFETLTGLIEAYDVASICIWHRIDSIRSLEWKLVAADDSVGDVGDAIRTGMEALEYPDRINAFDAWLAKWLYDILAYDAGTLYRLRNRAGRCVGLKPVDGRSIAPLLDYWGDPPAPPAESHVQYVNGLPWNWLTRDDLIYQPFRPRNNSPYGTAPLETILLNANTDVRFQLYFLGRFTEGNLPAAFAASPESWSPDQIEQFQEYWDSFMYGDQGRKHQIRWMPGGSKIAWSNEKDFSDVFSLFMMRKTCSAYHVVPADLGFTENVNRSSGESQADVQHRVGDLPLIRFVHRVLSGFLQRDLGLPLRFTFDLGEEQDDRYQQAQADDIYVKMGAVGPSEIREMRYGRPEPEGRPVPRFIFSSRQGPIPLASLSAVAGEIDPQTGAPVPGAKLPKVVFGGAEGVLPNPPIKVPSLAEQEFGESAMPPAPPPQPQMAALPAPVAKEGEAGSPAPGITSETGIYGDPLIRDEDEDEQAVAKEMAAFRRFERTRRKSGEWRDFRFAAVGAVTAHNLNDAGRLAVRKAAGEVAVAGLAVLAADTGRVLMLQRALSDDDPAGGKLEFPGGHMEEGESPLQAAWREFAEETGCPPPAGEKTGEWTAGDGIYRGIAWTTESEASVPVRGDAVIPNPDADPDGDSAEAIMWVDPADLAGNPIVRDELAASLDDVMAALGIPDDGKVTKPSVNYRPSDDPARCCGTCLMIRADGDGGYACTLVEGAIDPGAVCDEWDPAAEGDVAKAAGPPKALEPPERTGAWPGIYDRRARLLARHERAVAAAWDACLAGIGSPRDAVRSFRSQAAPVAKAADPDRSRWKDAGTAAALAWLERIRDTKGWPALVAAIEAAITDGMAEGQADALALAATRQGVKGLAIAAAFTAAAAALQGSPSVSRKAQDTADGILNGSASDVGSALADAAEDDGSEQDMTSAAQDAASGGSSRSLASWLKDAIWGAIAAGVAGLISRVNSGEPPEGETPPGEGPPKPMGPDYFPPPQPLMLSWVTDGRPCPACIDNEAGSPYAPQDVPPLPQHPRCMCNLVPADNIPSSYFAAYLLS